MTTANSKLKLSDFHTYQNAAVEHLYNNANCGLFLDMGLGKTVITLTYIELLRYQYLEMERALLIAPKRVVDTVWSNEVDKWEHLSNLTLTKIVGHQKQRDKALLQKTDIHLLGVDNVAWMCGKFGGHMPYDTLIIDESSCFKSPKSQRFKALRLVMGNFKRVVILTGTPAPNSLIDLWPQIYLLDRGLRLGKTITAYREEYFKPGMQVGQVVYNYKIQATGEERIHAAISDVCLSMSAKDYLSLPERINNYIEVTFDAELQKKYDTFKEEKILQFIDSGVELSAINAAGLINKLLQFANGAIYYEDIDLKRDYQDVHDLKLDALAEILEVNDKPILVAYAFKHDLERILARFQKYKPVVFSGDADVQRWNKGEIRMMVMHPKSGGHGLNLQYGGNILVWFGLTWSLELYQQFNARIDRQGQVEPPIIHHIIANNTYDNAIIKSLTNKAKTQNELMEAVKFEINEYIKRMKL
jgi:SNF2 family DNA or RNA helicase